MNLPYRHIPQILCWIEVWCLRRPLEHRGHHYTTTTSSTEAPYTGGRGRFKGPSQATSTDSVPERVNAEPQRWTVAKKGFWGFSGMCWAPALDVENLLPASSRHLSFAGPLSMSKTALHCPQRSPSPAPARSRGRGRGLCSCGRRESVCSSREKRPGRTYH